MMSRWVKLSNFEVISNAIYYNRELKYRNNETGAILTIYGFPGGSISIEYNSASQELHHELIVERQGFINHYRGDKSYSDTVGVKSSFGSNKLKEFLQIVDKHDSLSEILDEIYTAIKLRKPAEMVIAECLQLLNENNFDAAIEHAVTAQSEKFHDVIWELIQVLSSRMYEKNFPITQQRLIEICDMVTETNPNYKSVQELAMNLSFNNNSGSVDEMAVLRTKIFERSINAGNQRMSDQIFNILCGNSGLSPDITGVKLDVKTLVSLANRIKDLQGQNNILSSELKQLRSTYHLKNETNKTDTSDKLEQLNQFNPAGDGRLDKFPFWGETAQTREWDQLNTGPSDHPDTKPAGPGYGF